MFEIIDSEDRVKAIASQWNNFAESLSQMPDGVGPTSLFDLAMLAKAVHAPDAALCVYVTTEDGHINALLPCYSLARRLGPIKYTQAGLMSDLYPGRTGPLYHPSDIGALESLLVEVMIQTAGYELLEMTFVDGSESESLFQRLAKELGKKIRLISSTPCPYICLPEKHEELAATFSSKFRYNIRSREKKMRASGRLAIRRFEQNSEVSDFLRYINTIERGSWKESAGTSLTQNPRQQAFHERVASICARHGILRGYVMSVDDEPVAHIIGLYFCEIFYCLKSSFTDRYREFSPGVVLKSLVLQELIEDGARYWDFVGPAEDHKMQWTKNKYTLNKYAVYSDSLMGRLLGVRADISQWFRNSKQA